MHAHLKKLPIAKKILSSAISAIALISLSGSLYAQIGSASLSGIVETQDKPVAGVEVTAVNVANGHSYKVVTQTSGSYLFTGLPPGVYRMAIAGKNIQDQQQVNLRV